MIRLGVTGTDTGVGKTVVGCAMARALTRRGLRVSAMKPVETGCAFGDPERDGALLARAANESRGLATVAPLTFPDPVAPVLAAERAGTPIDINVLDDAVTHAAAGCDVLLVEGAGGLLVPVTAALSYDALFRRWSLDVVIVAGNKLGVINHTRLTVAAARAAGLVVHAIVLNDAGADRADRSIEDNQPLIHQLTRIPVVRLPHLASRDDLDHAAALVEQIGLIDLLVPSTVPILA